MAVIGVLYDTLLKISTLESNSEAELSRIMSVLGIRAALTLFFDLQSKILRSGACKAFEYYPGRGVSTSQHPYEHRTH